MKKGLNMGFLRGFYFYFISICIFRLNELFLFASTQMGRPTQMVVYHCKPTFPYKFLFTSVGGSDYGHWLVESCESVWTPVHSPEVLTSRSQWPAVSLNKHSITILSGFWHEELRFLFFIIIFCKSFVFFFF